MKFKVSNSDAIVVRWDIDHLDYYREVSVKEINKRRREFFEFRKDNTLFWLRWHFLCTSLKNSEFFASSTKTPNNIWWPRGESQMQQKQRHFHLIIWLISFSKNGKFWSLPERVKCLKIIMWITQLLWLKNIDWFFCFVFVYFSVFLYIGFGILFDNDYYDWQLS